jgi:phosphoglycerate dehydrogenase-like enzyme
MNTIECSSPHARRSPSQRTLAPLLACVLVAVAGSASARGPAPDPRAIALIAELGLREGAVATRDLPGWKVPERIVIAPRAAAWLPQLQAVAPGIELVVAADGAARAGQLAGAQAVIGMCDGATLEAAKSVRWIQALSAGVEECVAVPGVAGRGLVLTNLQRMMGPPMAEHAIAMMLALARGLPQFARHQQAARWQDGAAETARMHEIGGRTLLVVGLGGIGTEVARRAHALGMRVVATRNSSREGPPFVARVGLPSELHALAAEADVVVNALPITPETTGVFDSAFFAVLKPGAYFISVGRGASTRTDALIEALRSGRLAGAGLDVTDPEPLPADSPLWAMPNVIITPHVSASSDVRNERFVALVAENVRRYVAGEPLLNVVDIARGY